MESLKPSSTLISKLISSSLRSETLLREISFLSEVRCGRALVRRARWCVVWRVKLLMVPMLRSFIELWLSLSLSLLNIIIAFMVVDWFIVVKVLIVCLPKLCIHPAVSTKTKALKLSLDVSNDHLVFVPLLF